MDQKLLDFNAFGLVVVRKNKITASLTTVSGERSITRTINKEDVELKQLKKNDVITIAVGVKLEKGKASRVTMHETGNKNENMLAVQIPEVGAIVEQVIKHVKKGASIE